MRCIHGYLKDDHVEIEENSLLPHEIQYTEDYQVIIKHTDEATYFQLFLYIMEGYH